MSPCLKDWSLITGKGAYQMGLGVCVKFYPYVKGGMKGFTLSCGGVQTVSDL